MWFRREVSAEIARVHAESEVEKDRLVKMSIIRRLGIAVSD